MPNSFQYPIDRDRQVQRGWRRCLERIPRAPLMHDPPRRAAGMALGRGVQHPVPIRIFYWSEGRFETIEAVNYAAAQELVQKINAEKGARGHAYIPEIGEP